MHMGGPSTHSQQTYLMDQALSAVCQALLEICQYLISCDSNSYGSSLLCLQRGRNYRCDLLEGLYVLRSRTGAAGLSWRA